MMSVRSFVLAAGVVAASATSASAGVVVTSRASSLQEVFTDGGPFGYTESDSFSGLGAWDRTLPHGYRTRNAVSNTTISGNMSGSINMDPRAGTRTARECSMSVTMVAAGGNGQALLHITSASNTSWYPGMAYTGVNSCNIYLRLTNTTTNQVVFDLFNDGISTISGGQFSFRSWGAQDHTLNLADGTYRLDVVGHGVNAESAGGGSPSSGSGSINFGITLVPAPGASAALVGGLLVATRRRRA